MERLEQIRTVVDDILQQQPGLHKRRCGFVHLYGVAAICSLLALKRGLNPQLCAIAGMLHDIWAYKIGDPTNHAALGAREAEKLLRESDAYTDEEISQICVAIACHSSKDCTHDDVAELLKDADVLQHHLYNPALETNEAHVTRLNRILGELGICSNNPA